MDISEDELREISHQIGKRIQELRKAAKLTQSQL